MRRRSEQASNPSTRPGEADQFWASVLMAVAAVEDRPPPEQYKKSAPETGQPPARSTPAKRVRVRRFNSTPASARPSSG